MEKTKKGVELADLNRELKKVVETGQILIGSKETIKALRRKGTKFILYASNCPAEIRRVFMEHVGDADLTIYDYPADSFELGLACGKPYPIASLCITDPGDSEIVRLLSPGTRGRVSGVSGRERSR